MDSFRSLAPRPPAHRPLLVGPPRPHLNAQKQRRHRHTDKEWEAIKPHILQLYQRENKTEKRVRDILSRKFNFETGCRTFKSKVREWGIEKNERRRGIATQQSLTLFPRLVDPFVTPNLQGTQWTLGASATPRALWRLWRGQLPWFQFQNDWSLPINALSTCQFLDLETFPTLRLLSHEYRSGPLLRIEWTKAYETLQQRMPEMDPHEHVGRANAIMGRLGVFEFLKSTMELVLFLASNNLSLDNRNIGIDHAILDITEFLLRIKAPIHQLTNSSKPTAQALAYRIFTSALSQDRADLLERLFSVGFISQSWIERPLPDKRNGVPSPLPIRFALANSRLEVVKFLLQHGANINVSTSFEDHRYGFTLYSAARGRTEVVEFVLQHPKFITIESDLLDALDSQQYPTAGDAVAGLLLDRLYELNLSQGLKYPTRVLLYAIRHCHQQLIDDIVPIWDPQSQYSELFLESRTRSTPLCEAVYHRNQTLCERLLCIEMSHCQKSGLRSDSIFLAVLTATHLGYVDFLQLFMAGGVQTDYFNDRRNYNCFVGRNCRLLMTRTALDAAIQSGEEKVVQFLLDEGAVCNKHHLMHAFNAGEIIIFKKLSETGLESPLQTPNDRRHLLLSAIRKNNEMGVNYLLDNNFVEYDVEALLSAFMAFIRRRQERVADIAEEGHSNEDQQHENDPLKDPLFARLLSFRRLSTDREGGNALLESLLLAMAVYEGYQHLVSQLMDDGFVFDSDLRPYAVYIYRDRYANFAIRRTSVRDNFRSRLYIRAGCSLIGVALLGGQDEMLDFLINCGHQPSAIDFHCGFNYNESGLVKLLASPSFVNLTREEWPSCLPLAIDMDMSSLVDFFLEGKTNVNAFSLRTQPAKSGGLRTALQAASAKGDMTRMRLLIERGAEVNSPAANFRGATALQYAVMGGFFRAMRLLIEEGADTNAPGAIHFGRTALEAAAEHGRIDMIKYLLLAGAETTGEYQWQYLRAVGFAKRRGHHAAAQLLENHRDWTDEDRAMCECEDMDADLGAIHTHFEMLIWESDSEYDSDDHFRAVGR